LIYLKFFKANLNFLNINLKKNFLEEMELNVYNNDQSSVYENNNHLFPSSSIPFLKCLNNINSCSFKLMLNQILTYLKINNRTIEKEQIFFKFLVLLSINGNDYMTNLIMSQLMLIPNNQTESSSKWSIIIKFRQEVNAFHCFSLKETIKSISKSFANDSEENDLLDFIKNLVMIYDWDLKNKHFMR
jgi:hypothetical protein